MTFRSVQAVSPDVGQHRIEIIRNKTAWDAKPALREVYHSFQQRIATEIDRSLPGLIVELGSGMGAIKAVIPDCITTDLFPNPWLDRQENAYRLGFPDRSLSHLILFDVWHHLRYPHTALLEFRRVLVPGGRVILFEPAMSWLGRLAYGLFHHEPLGLGVPVTPMAPAGFRPEDADYFAAQGAASRMFWWDRGPALPPGWRVHAVEPVLAFPYFATGGFSGPAVGGALAPAPAPPGRPRPRPLAESLCSAPARSPHKRQIPMILVTGAAGFIGFHVSRRLLRDGHSVLGVDHLSDYYDVTLKEARLKELAAFPGFAFARTELADALATARLFAERAPDTVVHLAAQAGVRYSITHPHAYAESNLLGFLNVLEGCRHGAVRHLVYASSSSVYGLSTELPFSVHGDTDHPVSLYAATKKANELMAHSYSHLYGIPTTGLRLFTVYGPWGRPDMALFSFTKAILEGKPITVFGEGKMRRDFTFIDDAVEGIARVVARPAAPEATWRGDRPDPATSSAPYRLYNIGNRTTVEVLRLIEILEACLGRTAQKQFVESQACEVPTSVADTQDLERDFSFTPATSLEAGVAQFVDWYRAYYRA